MNTYRARPILELTPVQFYSMFKNKQKSGSLLTYRIKWLIKKVKELGLDIYFKKRWGRYIVKIHIKYLRDKCLPCPFIKNEYVDDAINHLIKKEKYKPVLSWEENVKKLSRWWYIDYHLTSEIKAFIFYLIKKYHDRKKD